MHSINPNNIINNVSNDAALKLLGDIQRENLQRVLNQSVICNFALTKEQFDTASRVFAPYAIRYGEPGHNNHPVAALLNNFAYKQCEKESRRFRTAIDIGGSPLRTSKHHHICALVSDSRTDARYTECAFSQLNLEHEKVDFTDYLTPNRETLCLDGAQNCHYKAHYAYSTNVYDITPQNIVDIFCNHSLLVYDLWMFLPLNLVSQHFNADIDIYRNRILGDKCYFDLLDNSNIYIHDYKNWQFYATYTQIRCNNFTLVLEHKQNFSTFHQIRITRVENVTGDIRRMFNVTKLVETIAIPDLYYYINNGNMAIDPYINTFDVRATYVKKVMAHGTSMIDQQFTYSNLSKYCDSVKNTVTFAVNTSQEIMYQGIDPDPISFEHIKLSLFIICAITRYQRTQTLSTAMKYMRDNTYEKRLLSFSKWWVQFKFFSRRLITSLFPHKGADFEIHPHFIYDIKPVLPNDPEYNNIYFSDTRCIFPRLRAKRTLAPLKFDDTLAIKPLAASSTSATTSTYSDTCSISSYSSTIDSSSIRSYTSNSTRTSISLCSDPTMLYLDVDETRLQHIRTGLITADIRISSKAISKLRKNDRLYYCHNDDEQEVVVHSVRRYATLEDVPRTDHQLITGSAIPIIDFIEEINNLPGYDKGIQKFGTTVLHFRALAKSNNLSLKETNCSHVLHNPSGADGKCAYNALTDFIKRENLTIDLDIPTHYVDQDGLAKSMPENWWNDEELAIVCLHNNITFIIHQDGRRISYNQGTTKPFCANLSRAHWTVVRCECPEVTSLALDSHFQIADYATLPLEHPAAQQYIYVNAANHNLTDGAGQALAFSRLFPNYARNVQKPIGDYIEINHNGYILYAVVAYDNKQGKDLQKTNQTLDSIFKQLAFASKHYNRIVLLPLIGCGAYGADLCCFRTRLLTHDFSYRLVFHNNKQKLDYYNTKPCRHGGYIPLVDNVVQQINIVSNEKPLDYKNIKPIILPNHMQKKLVDIFDCLDSIYGGRFDEIHELTASPGHWLRYYPTILEERRNYPSRYVTHRYTGPNNFAPFKDVAFDYEYSDTLLHINKFSFNNTLIIYDYMPSIDIIVALISKLNKNNGNVILTKFDLHEDSDHQLKFNTIANAGCGVYPFINEATKSLSSEIYCFIFSNGSPIPATLDTQTILDKNIFRNEKHVLDHSCKCPIDKTSDAHFNCDITLKFDRNAIDYYDHIKESIELFVKGDRLTPILTQIKAHLQLITLNDHCKIRTINGAPGSRKTQSIVCDYCVKCSLFVAPFSKIINSLNNSDSNVKGITFMKFLVMLIEKKDIPNNIFFDELFATPPIYFHLIQAFLPPDVVIRGMGDYYQTIDKDYAAMGSKFDITYLPGKSYLSTSYRMPKRMCDLVKSYVKIDSKSKVDGIIEFADIASIDTLPYDKNIVLLTSTQDSKKQFLQRSKVLVRTIAEAQGETINEVHVYTPDITEIREDRVRHVYTAISRASQKVVFHGTEQTNEQFLTILSSPAERMLDSFGVVVTPVDFIEKSPPKAKIHTTVTTLNDTVATQAGVEEILDAIFLPTNDNTADVIAYKSDCIPHRPNKAALKMSQGYMAGGDETITGKHFGTKNYNQHYHPKNNTQTVSTLLTRYTKDKAPVPYKQLKKYVIGFKRWLRNDWEKYMQSKQTPEEEMRYLADYLVELQKKYPKDSDLDTIASVIEDNEPAEAYSTSLTDPVMRVTRTDLKGAYYRLKLLIKNLIVAIHNEQPHKILDLEKEWNDSYHKLVSFHLKRQPKLILKPGFDSIFKAGQGISAWSKLLNILFSTVTRHFSKNIKPCLLPNVQMSYGKSDAKLSLFFGKYAEKINSTNYTKMCADFSEFDSSQEAQGILSSIIILKICGYKTPIIDFYLAMRAKWTLFARSTNNNEILTMYLSGHNMQHSGQPFTLDGNTIFNMACMGMCYIYDDLICAAFKGDDSFILAKHIEESIDGVQSNVDICGFQIKIQKERIAEYIANIILPDGTFFPDVIRRISRVFSKVYTANIDWEEQRQSLLDSLDVVFDEDRLQYGCKVAHHYYAQFNIQISPAQIHYLLNFLHTLTKYDNIEHIPTKVFRILDLNDATITAF